MEWFQLFEILVPCSVTSSSSYINYWFWFTWL